MIRNINAIVGLLGIVGIVYSNSFVGVFVLDDYSIEHLREASWPSWGEFRSWSRPLVRLSFIAQVKWGAGSLWCLHLVNLSIHLVSVLCIFSIGKWVSQRYSQNARAGRSRLEESSINDTPAPVDPAAIALAWWTALLWGIHPLTTESVTYVVQRYESSAVMFMLLCVRCWLAILMGNRWAVLGVVLFGWAAVFSKQISISLPFLILACDWFFRHRSGFGMECHAQEKKRSIFVLRMLGFAGILSAWGYLMLHLSGYLEKHVVLDAITDEGGYGPGPFAYLRTQSLVIFRYLKLVILPTDLRLDYGWPVENDPLRYLPAMVILALTACIGLWAFSRRWIVGLLIVSSYLTLAPRSSFAPSPDIVFEHRMHFPLVFIIALLVAVCYRIGQQSHLRRGSTLILGFSMLLFWGFQTYLRNHDYHSPIRLWHSNFQLEPNNPRVASNLAMAYASAGQWAVAREYAERATQIHPDFANYQIGRGDTERETGDLSSALESFTRAIELAPRRAEAYQRRGYVLEMMDKPEAAERDYRLAARLGNAEAMFNLARYLEQNGRFAEALAFCDRLRQTKKYPRRMASLHARIIEQLESSRP